jgi:CheY-like chemotaxis protein
VLIVDDNATNRYILHHQLVAWGMRNGSAENGPQALDMLHRAASTNDPYGLAILDMNMPGMDGFELCKRIRDTACNPLTPVVFVTAHSDFDSRAKAALSGGQYLLGKPFLSLEITVKSPHLWSTEDPYIYNVYSEVVDGSKVTDSYTSPLGFRWFSWNWLFFEVNNDQKCFGITFFNEFEIRVVMDVSKIKQIWDLARDSFFS